MINKFLIKRYNKNIMDAGKELVLLKESVINLCDSIGYSFCFSCNNWGKKDSFGANICDCCKKWACDLCGGTEIWSYEDFHLLLCPSCDDLNKQERDPLFTIISFQCEKENVQQYFYDLMNEVNDYFQNGPHYQYIVNIIAIKKLIDDIYTVGLMFDIDDDYNEYDGDETLDDLIEDIMFYFHENDIPLA